MAVTLERNVGGVDRLGRAVLAVALLVVAVLAFVDGRRGVAVAATLGSAGLGFNAAVGVCGVNALLGIDTTTD